MNNLLFGDDTFGYYETICGGAGATPEAPGADAVHTHMTNTRNTPIEALEAEIARRWGSKGDAVSRLKDELGMQRVICFGDSDNDLSMFEAADESYAPANANENIKSAATAVIGHHDDEGIARFLRERFALDAP